MRVLIAAFYTPGIRAIEYLLQRGLGPSQIRLLTHEGGRNLPLLTFAAMHGIEVKTSSVKAPETYSWIEEFEPNVLFSLYFRDIVPQSILEIPALGGINLHPALLPKYRGTFSVPWAIINGETETGFSYHRMVSCVDAGKIVLQRPVSILPTDTAFSLYHRMIVEGLASFGEVFDLVTGEHFPGIEQVGVPSYYPRTLPFGGVIDPAWDRATVGRFIRALYFPPFPGAIVRLSDGSMQEVFNLSDYDRLIAANPPVAVNR